MALKKNPYMIGTPLYWEFDYNQRYPEKPLGDPYMATRPGESAPKKTPATQAPYNLSIPLQILPGLPYTNPVQKSTKSSTLGVPAAGALGTPAALATPATGAIETEAIGGGPAKSQRAVRARTKTMYSSYASQANVVRKILLGK